MAFQFMKDFTAAGLNISYLLFAVTQEMMHVLVYFTLNGT